MGWRDLLQTQEEERVLYPWVGGRSLRSFEREWFIKGALPPEHGWYEFKVLVRKAFGWKQAETPWTFFNDTLKGYLVGDRLIPDEARVVKDLSKLSRYERVHLVEAGLDRFVRVSAGRACEGGPLIYGGQEMPLGPEDEVLQAFLDDAKSVDNIAGVAPALDLAFRLEAWRRAEAIKRRREEQERREKEERRQRIAEQLGDGAGRRLVAQEDFGEAARAALAVGGAVYLDHRDAHQKGEVVVRFRLDRRRFECTCHKDTLRIIDSGICLTAHYDDPNFASGTKGDSFFTLESISSVIRQAENQGVLVVYRHVD
jgi:hypothetical protein